MKMFYGNTPIKSLNVKHYEMSTSDATVVPTDLQAGVTCYARGKKVTGTGRSFEFASYGMVQTNIPVFSPVIINIIEIASLDYPVKISMALNEMEHLDFSVPQTIGCAIIDGVEYPITAQVNGVILTLACEKTIKLEAFYGKDNYV
jgi:hypothetical protein